MSRLISHTYTRAILLLLIGCIVGWMLKSATIKSTPEPLSVRENSPVYNFINPLLYTNTDKTASAEYKPLEKELSTYITSAVADKNADSISVYFRDLNSGRWTGVNEDEKYNPGSMLKVAAMIGYLRDAQGNPSILNKKLMYTATRDPNQTYKPENPLPAGYYSVQELINAMIVQSDNEASKVLVQNNHDAYVSVENQLNLPKAIDNPNMVDFMSAKEYSSLFRVLYNATYLSRNLSDQVLRLLSETSFNNGLVAGLPTGTVVAHKFGEHADYSEGQLNSKELHDCGIIYYPEKPYFLCVMTKGKDFPKLEPIISNISKIVYESVMKQK